MAHHLRAGDGRVQHALTTMDRVVRHSRGFHIDKDSHIFMNKDELLADGWEPDCYPPCGWCAAEQPVGDYANGHYIRPPGAVEWGLYQDPVDRKQYTLDWEAICPNHLAMYQLACKNLCLICGDDLLRHPDTGECGPCRDERIAAIFGDYPPPTDCGCAWHSIYAMPDCAPEPTIYVEPITGYAQPRTEIGDGRLF